MEELLTTKELQSILQVDRTTIYRMADSGRLPAIKVGNQWRFPRNQVEAWLRNTSVGGSTPQPVPAVRKNGEVAHLFPLECVQLIQDSFADALGTMILLVDLDGNHVTEPSNPCGLFTATEKVPPAHQRCLDLWIKLARDPAMTPRLLPSHLGLLCARGLVRVGSEIQAMLIVGGIAPDNWPPSEAEIERIASDLGIEKDVIAAHVDQVHRLNAEEQQRVLPFVQRIADIFAHIASERLELFGRLQRISEISHM